MSQLPQTKTSTPKTTTGENLILGYTSHLTLEVKYTQTNNNHTACHQTWPVPSAHRPLMELHWPTPHSGHHCFQDIAFTVTTQQEEQQGYRVGTVSFMHK